MRRDKPGELQPAVAVWRAHHGNLDALISQSSDTPGPFSFDRGPLFELEAELAKEINCRCEVIDDDSYVVHPFKCHMFRKRRAPIFVYAHQYPVSEVWGRLVF